MPFFNLSTNAAVPGAGSSNSHFSWRTVSQFIAATFTSLFRINGQNAAVELANATPFVMYSDEFVTETFRLDAYGRPISTGSGVPTAAAGAQAGTSPPAPVVSATASDQRGSLTCGTGGSSATGALVVVTFNKVYAVAPRVVVVPANDATAALGSVAVTTTTTGFTIRVISPTASQANTVYAFAWLTVG